MVRGGCVTLCKLRRACVTPPPPHGSSLPQVVSPVQTSELALLVTTSCLQHNVVNHFRVTAEGVIDCTADSSGALLMRKFRLLHKVRPRPGHHALQC